MADRFSDDDYFAEPNYDKLSDEQLDELYYYGEIRTPTRHKKAAHKATMKKSAPRLFADDEDGWLDVDLDGEDDDLYED
ncbi:hypothetical protein [Granulosicoccus sp. 3-233]|uniref:hypothetical protein n=1 Tax=Granulosicoccus sp. 3-233 TaxID=3417969 RepID=UPI003D33830A